MRMIVKMMVAAAALLALTVGLIASGEVSAEHAIGDDPAVSPRTLSGFSRICRSTSSAAASLISS